MDFDYIFVPNVRAAGIVSQDLTIHQMRVFSATVQHGGISRAAHALSMPQPAVSRLLARIEANVGTRLLTRSGAGISLTPPGERFLRQAEKVLHHHDLAFSETQAIADRLVGQARIAAPESVGDILFVSLLKHFQQDHPDADVRAIAAHSASIPTLLDNGMIDIGIVADTHPPPSGTLELLYREAFYLIGPKGARETFHDGIALKQAAGLPLILNAMEGGFRSVLDAAFSRQGLSPNVRIEIDANAPLLDLILAGEGFSILPYSIVARKPQLAGLSAAQIIDPIITRRLSLAMAPGRPASPVCREVAKQIAVFVKHHSVEARWLTVD